MFTCYFDGGLKNNVMTYGFVAYDSRKKLRYKEGGKFQENKNTTNIAEYKALIKLLEWLVKNGIRSAQIFGDSQIIINQINGDCRVGPQHLRDNHNRVYQLIQNFDKFSIDWIPREKNKEADSLTKNY